MCDKFICCQDDQGRTYGEGREEPWGAVWHYQGIEEGCVVALVGQKIAREGGREEGQVYQNFGVFATEMTDSVDAIRPYLRGGPGWP